MVIEPNEDQQRIFDLRANSVSLEHRLHHAWDKVRELETEVERLEAENKQLRQSIELCSGSCRLPE